MNETKFSKQKQQSKRQPASSKKRKPLSSQIRGLQRLINKAHLQDHVIAIKQKELEVLQQEFAKRQQKALAQQYYIKNKKAKFFDSVKINRRLKQLNNIIEQHQSSGRQVSNELMREVESLKRDMQHIEHFPPHEKYVSIVKLPEESDKRENAEKEIARLRSLTAKVAAQLATVQDADEGVTHNTTFTEQLQQPHNLPHSLPSPANPKNQKKSASHHNENYKTAGNAQNGADIYSLDSDQQATNAVTRTAVSGHAKSPKKSQKQTSKQSQSSNESDSDLNENGVVDQSNVWENDDDFFASSDKPSQNQKEGVHGAANNINSTAFNGSIDQSNKFIQQQQWQVENRTGKHVDGESSCTSGDTEQSSENRTEKQPGLQVGKETDKLNASLKDTDILDPPMGQEQSVTKVSASTSGVSSWLRSQRQHLQVVDNVAQEGNVQRGRLDKQSKGLTFASHSRAEEAPQAIGQQYTPNDRVQHEWQWQERGGQQQSKGKKSDKSGDQRGRQGGWYQDSWQHGGTRTGAEGFKRPSSNNPKHENYKQDKSGYREKTVAWGKQSEGGNRGPAWDKSRLQSQAVDRNRKKRQAVDVDGVKRPVRTRAEGGRKRRKKG